MEAQTIFWLVFGFSWLEYVWEEYLGHRQRKVYRKYEGSDVPQELSGVMDKITFEKSRAYACDRSSFGFVKGGFAQLVSTVIMLLDGYKFVWVWSGDATTHLDLSNWLSDEVYQSCVMVFIVNMFTTVISIPFSIYGTFVLEEKYGFNKQTVPFFIKDTLKSIVVSQIITIPLIGVIVKIILSGGDLFFLYLWLFVLIFTIFMMVIYPEFIAPLFDKYSPLPEGQLKTEIENLAASINFPLYKLYVVEGSKRSAHSNAYFYGFHKFKRIVLFDTLLEEEERKKLNMDKKNEEKEEGENKTEESDKEGKKDKGCTIEEISAVLGHELGHWKLNHVLKNFVISEVHIFLMFALFAYIYKMQVLYAAFGFADEMPAFIGLIVVMQFVMAPFNSVVQMMVICLSRKFEFEADMFAFKLGKSERLKSALIKLNNDNLSFPIYDWLFSAHNHSHPPLLQRMAALEDAASNKKKD